MTTPLIRADTTINTNVRGSKVFALAFVKQAGVTDVFTETDIRGFVLPKLADVSLIGSAIVQLDSVSSGKDFHSGRGDEAFTGLLTKVFNNGVVSGTTTENPSDLADGINVYFMTMDGLNETAVRVAQPPAVIVTELFDRYPEYTWTSFTPETGFYDGQKVTLTDENISSVNGEYKIYSDVTTLGENYTHKAFIDSSEVGWFCNHVNLAASLYVEMPKPVVLEYYRLSGTTGHDQALPDEWALYGSSNQGASWSLISEVTDSPLAANDVRTIQLSAPSAPYDRFKLTLRKTTDTSDPYLGLSNLKFGIQTTFTASDRIELPVTKSASAWTAYSEPGFFDAHETVVSDNTIALLNGSYKVYGSHAKISADYYTPYSSIDAENSFYWLAKNAYTSATLYLELPVSVQMHSYKISPGNSHNPAIADEWTLSGSSDGGATWNVISDVSGVTLEVGVLSTVTLDAPAAPYHMYKLELRKTTETNDQYVGVGKFIPIVLAAFS